MRSEFLPYCRPFLEEDEIEAVTRALRKGWLTSGPQVKAFESAFAARSGVEQAIALSSCTAALHVALAAMDVGPGDEVVMPSLTFVAGAQCTLELGAIPVFADVDTDTLTMGPQQAAAAITKHTKAIIAMPYAGRPMDVGGLVQLAHERGIRVIEDAAHAAGMLDRSRWAGTRSDAAAFSFYATKNMTTAEGGMLLTSDAFLAERARTLGLHGMSKDAWKRYTSNGTWRYDVVAPGFKYNLADPLAALGLQQLARLDEMQKRRNEIAARYTQGLREMRGIDLPAGAEHDGDRHSWCMYVVLIDPARARIHRDAFIDAMTRQNIGTSVHYIPTHLFAAYRSLHRSPLPNTDFVWERLVSLPLYPGMSDDDVDDVLDAIERTVSPRAYALESNSAGD